MMDVINVVYRPAGTLSNAERIALYDIVELVANDFVPSLTTRTSTTQTDLTSPSGGSVDAYFNEMLLQHTLLALASDGTPTAFLSFRTHHVHPIFPERGLCFYVSTLAVLPNHRRAGYARRLYLELFKLSDELQQWVLLRTWSDNFCHLRLLNELGFRILVRFPDDRGPGLDTIYLAREGG